MKIANQFTVSAPIDKAWDVLCDLEQVIPLMPGAALTGHEGDDYLGKVKVKVGPVTSEFNGKVRFVEQDRGQHRAVIDAKGKETRGHRQRGRHGHRPAAGGRRAHQRHRRHRSEDRRQAGPVRQRHAAAGVGEVAGPVRGIVGSRTGGAKSADGGRPRPVSRADSGLAGKSGSGNAPSPRDASPSPSTCWSSPVVTSSRSTVRWRWRCSPCWC